MVNTVENVIEFNITELIRLMSSLWTRTEKEIEVRGNSMRL